MIKVFSLLLQLHSGLFISFQADVYVIVFYYSYLSFSLLPEDQQGGARFHPLLRIRGQMQSASAAWAGEVCW